MALDIDGLSRTLVLVEEGSPVTITSGTTWESPEFAVEHTHGRGAYSLECTLDGGGAGIITIELRGGNYRRTSAGTPAPSLPEVEGVDSSQLPVTDAAAITAAKEILINVDNHNMSFAQVGLAATGANVTLTNAVLRYG